MLLTGNTILHAYEPPEHAGPPNRAKHLYLKTKHPEEFVFDADLVYATCSPNVCETMLAELFAGLEQTTAQALQPKLAKEYRERQERLQERRREHPFAGYRTLDPSDRRRCFLAVQQTAGRDRWVWLSRDNHLGWDVIFGGVRGGILGYYSRELLAANPDPVALERRAEGDELYYEVEAVRGEVELALEDSETMAGALTFVIRAKRRLEWLPFFIARFNPGREKKELKDPDLRIHSVRQEDGGELTGVRLNAYGGIIYLAAPLEAGQRITICENRKAIYELTPSYSAVSRGGWLPFVRFGHFMDSFDLTLRVPSRYSTLGVGEKVEERVEGGVRVTRWVSPQPVNFPTVIFGDYIEDSATVQSTKMDGTPIPVHIYVDRVAMGDWDIRPKQLQPLADQAANALNFFREYFQVDYPFSKLELVNDPLGFLYGQSPSSIVYLGSGAFRGEGTMGVFGGAGITRFMKDLVPHEIAHQWWGNRIANANGRNYWFVESLAEYSSALYVEAAHGRADPKRGWKVYLSKVADWRAEILEGDLYGSVQDASELASGGYRALLYAEGPYAFHILRMTFGTEKFDAFMRALARSVEGKEIVTYDIQRVVEQAFGGDMDWFFSQWIRGVGIPESDLHYDVQRTEDGTYPVQGRVRQQVVIGESKMPLEGAHYRAVVTVTAVGRKSGKEFTVRVLVEGPETPFRFKVPEEPLEVVLNRYHEVLAHDVELLASR